MHFHDLTCISYGTGKLGERFFKCLSTLLYLFEKERGEMVRASICWFIPEILATTFWPGQSHKTQFPPRFSGWLAGCCLLGTLAGSWNQSKIRTLFQAPCDWMWMSQACGLTQIPQCLPLRICLKYYLSWRSQRNNNHCTNCIAGWWDNWSSEVQLPHHGWMHGNVLAIGVL